MAHVTRLFRGGVLTSAALLAVVGMARAAEQQAIVVDAVPAEAATPLYAGNRDPLAASPLVKLPIGAIKPGGWLLKQLQLEADGMAGHLPAVSQWCKFEGNAWTTPDRSGKNGWEEVPYWLKGYGDLGYVLGDQRIIAETKRWLDAIIVAQADDGWFGPDGLKTNDEAKHKRPDLWPHMPVLNAFQSYYEYTEAQGKPDERAIKLMDRFFKWELAQPEEGFLRGYWAQTRTGDNLESVYWLYNRTGEKWLLDLADKIQRHTPNWAAQMPTWHNVNIAQGFREPAEWAVKSHDAKDVRGTDHVYDLVMGLYGQVPGGGFAADENARPGYADPRQGFETCGMVEFMHSFEMLTRMQARPVWADRCEDVAFNSFPASMTPDLKALHYLTSPNSVQLDEKNHSPDIQNGGTMISYSAGGVYRCCQHNHGMGWPYYAEELWAATADQGLCASLYAPNTVTAKVKGGTSVTVAETTDYPFDGTVTFKVATGDRNPPEFPLYLRIPKWADGATVKVNGQPVPAQTKPESYLVLNRTWTNGDTVTLMLPMKVSVHTWNKNKDSVSVDYGPLTFALDVGEKWTEYHSKQKLPADFPEYDVTATTPWNYGLVLDAADPAKGIEVKRKPGAVAEQPWTPESSPLTMTVRAKKIPNWQKDRLNMVGLLQPSPVRSDEPTETVTLIPMGAARLRISQFPTIGTGPDAHDWPVPPVPAVVADYKVSASHRNPSDSLDALCDGVVPGEAGSAEQNIPRFSWWDHRGTAEWVQYDFKAPVPVSSAAVYWYDDAKTGGGCRPPASWQVMYKDGDAWKPVANASPAGTADDTFNKVTFDKVTTTALRLQVQLKDGVSAGILEWRVGN